MQDVVLGLVAVLVGAALCFRGYAALRVIIALWGAFVGFLLGAGVVASATGDPFLGTAGGWLAALVGAVLFGLVAYLFYAISIVIGLGAIGFALGTTLLSALGVEWSWVTVLGGLVVGVLLAVIAVVGDLPRLLLVVLGALAGASTLLTGVLLLIGSVGADELSEPTTIALEGWWYVAYVVLAVIGIVVQLRDPAARRGTVRESWGAPRAA